MRDSELQKRIDRLNHRIRSLDAQEREAPLFSEMRRVIRADRERAARQLAMLTEDDRRPTFAPPSSKQTDADEYREWLKSIA